MNKTPRITIEENNKRINLHSLGYTNIEMAKLRGISCQSMYRWIIRQGLKPNKKAKYFPIKYTDEEKEIAIENAENIKYYLRRYSDKRIADKRGKLVKDIQLWRRSCGLKPNANKGRRIHTLEEKAKRKAKREIIKYFKLKYSQGNSVKYISKDLHKPESYIFEIRYQLERNPSYKKIKIKRIEALSNERERRLRGDRTSTTIK
jgi:hypothetical protein